MKKSTLYTIYANRYEVKKQGHESALMVYGVKPNLDTDYENLIYSVNNICLLPIKEYTKLIEKSKSKKLAKIFYNSFDTIYQMLYQQTLFWYFNITKKPEFDYKHQYDKFFNRILDENSCLIISEVSDDYNLRENFLNVFSQSVKYAILNKIENADEVLYKENSNPKNRQKTELGEWVFSKIINAVYYSALQFIRNDATRHIIDSPTFLKKMDGISINLNPEYPATESLDFFGYFKLKNESITVNSCYNILKEGDLILHSKNSYKTFKSLFKKGEKQISEKIEWTKDIKSLAYFIKLLHEGNKAEQLVAPCEKKTDLYTIANEFFSIKKKHIGLNSLRNNNRILKNQIDIENIKKAVKSLNSRK